ncbi:MAG: segregation and condensation protein A [Mycobacteriales bacterium]
MVTAAPPRSAPPRSDPVPFEVHLDVFAGPFDLLLRLISKHQLDVTEVALAQVTDEFLAHLRGAAAFDLEQATEFLVVAATLLDLKTARLLPAGEVEEEEDLALLEARDVLFARLLAYRAVKQVAELLGAGFAEEERWVPRNVGLEAQFAAVLPDVVVGVSAVQLAALAAAALVPRVPPEVSEDHLHLPRVSVREHAAAILEQLQTVGTASFRALCAGCRETIEVVARFLAVLDLFREGRVSLEQLAPFGELQVRWRPVAASAEGAS